MRARGNEIIFLGLNQSLVFFYIEPYVARSIMSTAINNHTHNITLMYRCWVSTGDVIMCVHWQSEVHLLRREVSPPPESSNVSGRFGNTCALLSLCLSLTLTADTEARNVIYAVYMHVHGVYSGGKKWQVVMACIVLYSGKLYSTMHLINTILYHIAGNFRGRKLSWISRFSENCKSWGHGVLWEQQRAICKSFVRENLFSTSLRKFSPTQVSHYTV